MTRVLFAAYAALLASLFTVQLGCMVALTPGGTDTVSLAAVVTETVVYVSENAASKSYGSGVIVSQKYVLTCAHVVRNFKTVQLYFFDNYGVTADVVATDPASDLALLKVDLAFTVASLPVSQVAAVPGQPVMAVGHPRGMWYTVSLGHVSARNRTLSFPDGRLDRLLQHTAPINPGNSGGPLVNMRGQLVGLNNAMMYDSNNLGFAVDLETVREFLTLQGFDL